MKLLWIISFFLLQDTETFLLQNAKVKQCLQASLTDGDLLLSDCNSASHFQNWFWQGDSLRNHGTQSCLSVVEADRVQISPCDSVGFTSWNCSNSLLFPLGSSQGYLVASKKGVALENVRGLKAQWQSAAERSVCKEKPAAQYSYLSAALTSTDVYDHTAYSAGLLLDMEPEKLEELLWFFRREDPSPWNYSILALSFVVTILGFVLLSINISRNRKRKIHMYKEAAQAAQNSELETKQALITVPEYSPESPQKPEPLPQDERSGEVLVQWKDGTVTSLYRETAEDAM
ncbi:organic solute transporter subunit beta isoform X1 [Centrocercus urophasianus]|uniref:organic solute transporter subunit beta isoform X1 n=1 Tax=Centrocercus urophasianus TaxID=9002 RepID=UPI001C650557|nr:organic solute transporter subunit beta isoform X1 [Centrocercus urophasianus]XP_042680287.1 organic solute transporter subunit beta isoform X1 [Centrocercus urophasianus]XP_042680288.1 organic solute transporter subunit beta isoform X1 [Centrocercus urophasianus]XP_042680289.1 organic solute transporter subunit beta isoform X1 [Centrocercus urophasianus]XP_042680290.1 organic solute transporter subunit beta isoform X1 [Centrocercus urophasianus]